MKDILKPILTVWLIANFVIVGLASLLTRQWYLGWQLSPIAKLWAELGLVMLPNLALPVAALIFWWRKPINTIKADLNKKDFFFL